MAKKVQPKLSTQEDVNQALLKLGRIQADQKSIESDINADIQDIKGKYQTEIDKLRQSEETLKKEIKKYCNYNKKEFEKKGIKKLLFGKFGFRTNPAKAALLNNKWDWDKVEKRARELFKNKFLHIEVSFNKELAIRLFEDEKLKEDDLTAMGVKITKGKTFVCEPDWIEIKKLEGEKK